MNILPDSQLSIIFTSCKNLIWGDDSTHRLDYATAHSDAGLDIDGNQVIITQNTITYYVD